MFRRLFQPLVRRQRVTNVIFEPQYEQPVRASESPRSMQVSRLLVVPGKYPALRTRRSKVLP